MIYIREILRENIHQIKNSTHFLELNTFYPKVKEIKSFAFKSLLAALQTLLDFLHLSLGIAYGIDNATKSLDCSIKSLMII